MQHTYIILAKANNDIKKLSIVYPLLISSLKEESQYQTIHCRTTYMTRASNLLTVDPGREFPRQNPITACGPINKGNRHLMGVRINFCYQYYKCSEF